MEFSYTGKAFASDFMTVIGTYICRYRYDIKTGHRVTGITMWQIVYEIIVKLSSLFRVGWVLCIIVWE